MNLSGVLGLLREQAEYRALAEGIAAGEARGRSLGLIRAARPFVTAALAGEASGPVLVVTARMDRADNFAEQLLAWQPGLRVLTFPEPNALFYERAPWGPRTTRARLQVLAALANAGSPASGQAATVIVASARGLMQRTLPPDLMRAHRAVVEAGKRIPGENAEAFLRGLLHMGYEPTTVVTEPGTFSRRGGILDVYPVADSQPTRIELWGDEVESLRGFDPATQRSLAARTAVTISPARETPPVYGPVAAARLKAWFDALPEPEAENGADPASLRGEREKLLQQASFETLEFYLPWMFDQAVSLLEHLPGGALALVDDMAELADAVADLEAQAISLREAQIAAGGIPADMPLPLVTWDQIGDELALAGRLELGGPAPDEDAAVAAALGAAFAPGPRFAGELKHFLDHVRGQARGGHERLLVVSRQAERLAALWQERTSGAAPRLTETLDAPPEPGWPVFVQGALAEGWRLDGDAPTHLFTDAEIFGWRRPEPRRRPQPRAITPRTSSPTSRRATWWCTPSTASGASRGWSGAHWAGRSAST